MSLEKRLLEYRDLTRFEYVSAPVGSPDGSLIAYTVKTPETESGNILPTVFLTDPDGAFNYPLHAVHGDHTDAPCFSADGTLLAFCSDASGFRQIYLLDLQNFLSNQGAIPDSSCRKVTSLRHGISEYAFSPDGTHIAFSAPLYADDSVIFPEMTPDEAEAFAWQKAHLPKYISELMYKFDSCKGVKDGHTERIGIISAETPEPEAPHMITEPEKSYQNPSFFPDGTLLFTGTPRGGKDSLKKALYICRTPLSDAPGFELLLDSDRYQGSEILFGSDPSFFYMSSTETFSDDMLYNSRIQRVRRNDGETTALFPEILPCDGVHPAYVGITENGAPGPLFQFSKDEKTLFFLSAWDQKSGLYALDLSTKEIRKVVDGDFSITSFTVLTDRTLAVLLTTETVPLDLYLLDLPTGQLNRIVSHNTWLSEVELSIPVPVTMETDDPNMPVQGFLCPPALMEEGRTYASFHYIHGGPEAYYAVGFDFEIQMMAAKGLAVLYCNPRGSAGFGPEFVQEKWSYDGTAYQDLMDFTDFALKSVPYLDPERMAIGGGSHGGWMTNYIMGHTDRFKAAVNQRTFSNPATSYGTGDLGYYSWSTQGTASFMEYMEKRARDASMRGLDRFRTPCLILHGEKDYRCTLEQGEQVFSFMKARVPDVPVKMVVYPGENHGISRTGKIHWQISHLQEMIEWVLKYTGKEETK